MGVGLVGLIVLARYGGALTDATIVLVVREVLLLLVAIGFTRVTLMFLFQGVLARLAIPRILADVLIAVVLIVFALFRMKVVGVNLAGIITTSAVITGVIAFSLQETLGNLWGGIALQLDNTCRIGDWIRMEGVSGQVVGHPLAVHGDRDQQRRDRHHPQWPVDQEPGDGARAAR